MVMDCGYNCPVTCITDIPTIIQNQRKKKLIVFFDFKLKLYISTNVFDPSCYHFLGEKHISTESTKHTLTNFISHDLLFFVILREITNLILTVPSLDV